MKKVKFFIDDIPVEGSQDESIWTVAKRYGTTLPHTCVIQTNQVIEQMEIVEPVWFQLKVKEF